MTTLYTIVFILIISLTFVLLYHKKKAKLVCNICGITFFDSESMVYLGNTYCQKHLNIIKNEDFISIIATISNPEQTDDSLLLYNIKEKLWEKENIITYTQEKYIEVNDTISTTVTLYHKSDDMKLVSKHLNNGLNQS